MILAIEISNFDFISLVLRCRADEAAIDEYIQQTHALFEEISNLTDDPQARSAKSELLESFGSKLAEMMLKSGGNLQKIGVIVMQSVAVLSEKDLIILLDQSSSAKREEEQKDSEA